MARRSSSRRGRRLTALVVLTVAFVVGVACPVVAGPVEDVVANKVTDLCRSEPRPDDPRGGVGDLLAPRPPGVTQDPFTDSPDRVAIYDRYGYGGMSYPIYDLGCVEGAGATGWNSIANLEMRFQVWLIAVTGFLDRAADTESWWRALDPAVEQSMQLAQRLLWGNGGVLSFAVLLVAGMAAWVGIKRQISVLLKIVGTMLGVLVIGHLVAFNGVEVVHALRGYSTEFTSAFDAEDGTKSGADTIHREVVYRTWLAGMFGDADSPVAAEYGPRLFDCMVYRWDDPQTTEKAEEKQECFRLTMTELTEQHPVEANYAKGAETTAQLGNATLGLVTTFTAAWWRLIASLARIVLNLMWVIIPIALMFVVPFAMFTSGSAIVLRPMFDMAVGGIIKVAITAVVAQLYAIVTGALLGAGPIPWLLRFVLVILVFALSIKITKNHRKPLNGKVEGTVSDAAQRTANNVGKAAAAAAGIYAGIPPAVTEEAMGKVPGFRKKKKGDEERAHAGEIPQPEGWVAPTLALPSAGGTMAAGRPPLAWEGGAGSVPVAALRAGPLVTGAVPSEKTGAVPVAAIGRGPLPVWDPPQPTVLPLAARTDLTKPPAKYRAYAAEMRPVDVEGWVAPPSVRPVYALDSPAVDRRPRALGERV